MACFWVHAPRVLRVKLCCRPLDRVFELESTVFRDGYNILCVASTLIRPQTDSFSTRKSCSETGVQTRSFQWHLKLGFAIHR